MSQPLISVIIPTFNEELNVRRAYEAVVDQFSKPEMNYDFEIIFTDNCSTDNTAEVLKSLATEDPRVKVALFSRNFGFNKSILTGYRLATGHAAIQMDCDLQDSPAVFPLFLEKWRQGCDVVVGVRKVRQEGKILQSIRKAYYRILDHISEDVMIIDGGDFRLVDRRILQRLREVHDSRPYVRGLISALAKNQVGIPYERARRERGKSKFPFFRLLGLAIDGVVSHSTVPLRLASLIGVTISVATLLLASGFLIGKACCGLGWPAGFTTQVVLILFGISLNAIFLGIIGEYIARIHHQVKQQPLTIIKETLNIAAEPTWPKYKE